MGKAAIVGYTDSLLSGGETKLMTLSKEITTFPKRNGNMVYHQLGNIILNTIIFVRPNYWASSRRKHFKICVLKKFNYYTETLYKEIV